MAVSAAAAAPAAARPRVLLVDDETSLLQMLMRQLRHRFDVGVATGGMEGLKALAADGPFAVIVSDMRMPRMDGPTFLSHARHAAPDATRILLTGATDLDLATQAVNRGNIYRLLFKPCPSEALIEAIDAGVAQHQLVVAERELLEHTLSGAVRALLETLALACPAAFGKTQRVKRLVIELEARMAPRPYWPIELAASVAQLGAVSLPAPLIELAMLGEPLGPEDRAMLERVHEVTERLLAGIPRLEPVIEILRLQARSYEGPPDGPRGEALPLGARLLRAATDYDTLETQGLRSAIAISTLRGRSGVYDPAVVEALTRLVLAKNAKGLDGPEVREVGLSALRAGMVLAADLKSINGLLLLARGTHISEAVLRWFANHDRFDLRLPIHVLLPPPEGRPEAAEGTAPDPPLAVVAAGGAAVEPDSRGPRRSAG